VQAAVCLLTPPSPQTPVAAHPQNGECGPMGRSG
jgi:hypothetical protein